MNAIVLVNKIKCYNLVTFEIFGESIQAVHLYPESILTRLAESDFMHIDRRN